MGVREPGVCLAPPRLCGKVMSVFVEPLWEVSCRTVFPGRLFTFSLSHGFTLGVSDRADKLKAVGGALEARARESVGGACSMRARKLRQD